jgi:hypothetical protein
MPLIPVYLYSILLESRVDVVHYLRGGVGWTHPEDGLKLINKYK